MINRQIILKSRPRGVPQPDDFELRHAAIADPGEGEFLVENHFLSVDPAQRGYVNDENNYAPPLPLGSVMRALAVGKIIRTRHPDFSENEFLYGWFGWQDYCVATPSAVLRRVDHRQGPISLAAGLLGINGLTAHLALQDIGKPKQNEVVLVTAAAGAVGSIVGQLTKQLGCRAIAVVGSDTKGHRCVSEYGYDAHLNYNRPLEGALLELCPGGVDIFFDNTGGEIADTVIRHMATFGRVIQCGTMSITSWNPNPLGPRNEREILTRRLKVEGFVIFDHMARFEETAERLARMVANGELHYAEDISTEITGAPQALVDVYSGKNRGKRLIRLR